MYKNGFNNTVCKRTLNPDEKKFQMSQVKCLVLVLVVLNIQYCDPLLAGFACLPPTVPSFHARKHCVVTYGSTGACQRGFVVVGGWR